MLFGSAAIASMPIYASSTTILSAPTILDTTLGPGSTFYINITVADVSAMWGYEFTLSYDTTILTATSYLSYPPFIMEWPSGIDDEAGTVAVAYSMMLGETEGFSTVEPAPIARIDFTVDAEGWSFFDLYDSVVSDIYGETILHDVVDGLFGNVVPEWRADLVRRSAWPKYHHWSESKNPSQTIFGKVRNLGTLPTTAYVVFTVHNDDGLWQTTFTTDTAIMRPKQIVNLDVTITSADLIGHGKYYVQAQCWYDDGTGTFVPGIKTKSFTFSLV